jgi:hypothetical protein
MFEGFRHSESSAVANVRSNSPYRAYTCEPNHTEDAAIVTPPITIDLPSRPHALCPVHIATNTTT